MHRFRILNGLVTDGLKVGLDVPDESLDDSFDSVGEVVFIYFCFGGCVE